MSDCCTLAGIPEPAVAGPAIPRDPSSPCDMATPVYICEQTPPTPITVTGADCAGAPLAVTDPHVVLTVPAPGTVQLVKLCNPSTELDREYSTLCAPDGTKVLVVTAWDKTAPLATAPVVETYTLAGTAYTGDRALLTTCGSDKINTEHTDYCAAGINYTRIDGLAEETGLPVWTIWLNDAGLPVPQPAGAVKGVCLVAPCAPTAPIGVVGTWG